eukprot:6235756-Prymnesium_polylepis.2
MLTRGTVSSHAACRRHTCTACASSVDTRRTNAGYPASVQPYSTLLWPWDALGAGSGTRSSAGAGSLTVSAAGAGSADGGVSFRGPPGCARAAICSAFCRLSPCASATLDGALTRRATPAARG